MSTTVTNSAVTPAVAAASITPVQATTVMPDVSNLGVTESITTAGGSAIEVVKTEATADMNKAKAFVTGEQEYNVPGLGKKSLRGWHILLIGALLLILFALLCNWIFGWYALISPRTSSIYVFI